MDSKKDDHKKDFEIIVEDNWVRLRAQKGVFISTDLLLSTLEGLHSTEAYQNDKKGSLWDFRGCSSDLNFEKMNVIKKYIETHYNADWSHRFTAFVVDHDLLYGLARMYEMIAEKIPTTIHIFKDMDQAENWLCEEITKYDHGNQSIKLNKS